MIKYLNGIRETVDFSESQAFLLYDNRDHEEYPSHWHTPLEIIMPLECDYVITCETKKYLIHENELLIVAPGAIHKCHASSGRRLIFQVDLNKFEVLNNHYAIFGGLGSATLISEAAFPDIHEDCCQLMLNIMQEYFSNQTAREYSIASDVMKILFLLARANENRSSQNTLNATKHQEYMDKFSKIRDYISQNCTEDLTLEDVASLSGFSKFYFSRIFKEYSGVSYYKFLNSCRINYALELMMDPESNITEIAISSGFNSITSFIRTFKQIKGCTPSDYRKMHEIMIDEDE